MSYYFGVDNPYRAPKVAKEVVDYVGVRQEQVILRLTAAFDWELDS